MRRNRLTHAVAAVALALGGLGAATVTVVATVTATAPTAHADECYSWSRTLGSGASGADVAQLQIRVAGWVPRGQVMTVDGDYGTQTRTAVTNFQKAYGLTADGIAGPATFSKIYALQDPDCSPVHFSYAEASYNCGRGFTGGATEKENMKRALWRAEALRHQLGDHPLRVTSGYRDSTCNASVGGASNSVHLTGGALDLVPGDSATSICGIAEQARYAGFGGIFGPGYPAHDDHAHVDIRSTITWDADACAGW